MYTRDTQGKCMSSQPVTAGDESYPPVSPLSTDCSASPAISMITGQTAAEEAARVERTASPRCQESLEVQCEKEEAQKGLLPKEQRFPLDTLRSICDRMHKILERQEAVFLEVDAVDSQTLLRPGKSHLRTASPEKRDAGENAEKDLTHGSKHSQTTLEVPRMSDVGVSPHRQNSLSPLQFHSDTTVSPMTPDTFDPTLDSLAFTRAALTASSSVVATHSEEERAVQANLQQQEQEVIRDRERCIHAEQWHLETHGTASSCSLSLCGERIPAPLDSLPVYTSSGSAAFQLATESLRANTFSPTSCSSSSIKMSSSSMQAQLIGMGVTLPEENLECVSLSPPSRPVSTWLESPHSASHLRRDPSFPTSLHTSITSLAPPAPSLHLYSNSANNTNDCFNVDAHTSVSSPLNTAGGAAVMQDFLLWSCSGTFEASLSRTPRERSKAAVLPVEAAHLQNPQQQQQQPGCTLIRQDSSGSDRSITAITQQQQHQKDEQSPPARVPQSSQQFFRPFVRGECSALKSKPEALPERERAIVPPIPTMRRPPPVPQNRTAGDPFTDCDSDDRPDTPNCHSSAAERDFVEDFLLAEDQEYPEDEDEKLISHICCQRLFMPSPSRWRTSRRGRGARGKRGNSTAWDLSARFEELERIRMTNHEALEERQLQSVPVSETGAVACDVPLNSNTFSSSAAVALEPPASSAHGDVEVAHSKLEKEIHEEGLRKAEPNSPSSLLSFSLQSPRPRVFDDDDDDDSSSSSRGAVEKSHSDDGESSASGDSDNGNYDKVNYDKGSYDKGSYELEDEDMANRINANKTESSKSKNDGDGSSLGSALGGEENEGKEKNEEKRAMPAHVDQSLSTSITAPQTTITHSTLRTDAIQAEHSSVDPNALKLLSEGETEEKRGKKDLATVDSLYTLGSQSLLSQRENCGSTSAISQEDSNTYNRRSKKEGNTSRKKKRNRHHNNNSNNKNNNKDEIQKRKKLEGESTCTNDSVEENSEGEDEIENMSQELPKLLDEQKQQRRRGSNGIPALYASLLPLTPAIATETLCAVESLSQREGIEPLPESTDTDIKQSIATLFKTPITTPRLYLKRTPRSTALPRQASMRSWLSRLTIIRQQFTRRRLFDPKERENGRHFKKRAQTSSLNNTSTNSASQNISSVINDGTEVTGDGNGEMDHRRRHRRRRRHLHHCSLCVRQCKTNTPNTSAFISAGGPSTATACPVPTTGGAGTGGSAVPVSSTVPSLHSVSVGSAAHSHIASPNNHSANPYTRTYSNSSGNMIHVTDTRGSARNVTGGRGLFSGPTYLHPTESFSRHASGTNLGSSPHPPATRALRQIMGYNVCNSGGPTGSSNNNNNGHVTSSGPLTTSTTTCATEIRGRNYTISIDSSLLSLPPQSDSSSSLWSPRSRLLLSNAKTVHGESPRCFTSRTRYSAASPPAPSRIARRAPFGSLTARVVSSFDDSTGRSASLPKTHVAQTGKSSGERKGAGRVCAPAAAPRRGGQGNIVTQGKNPSLTPPQAGQILRYAARLHSLTTGSPHEARRFSYTASSEDHMVRSVPVRRRSLEDAKRGTQSNGRARVAPARFTRLTTAPTL